MYSNSLLSLHTHTAMSLFLGENMNNLKNLYKYSLILNFKFRKSKVLNTNASNDIKSFYSIQDIIIHLETTNEKKLSFTPDEKKKAVQLFKVVNYYHFSIYRKLLLDNKKIYTFTDCYEIYHFDNFLKNRLPIFTKSIELWIKATFTQSVCSNYKGKFSKGECYLDYRLYSSYEAYTRVIKTLEDRIKKSKSIYMKHHSKNRNNRYPFWVLVEELTFGEMTYIIEQFKSEIRDNWLDYVINDKVFINNNSKVNFKSKISSWISSTNYIRNICAHHSRLYGSQLNIKKPSYWNDDLKNMKPEKIKKNNNSTLFAHLLAIKNLLSIMDIDIKNEWNQFLKDIEKELHNSSNLHENHIGFVNNWLKYLHISL